MQDLGKDCTKPDQLTKQAGVPKHAADRPYPLNKSTELTWFLRMYWVSRVPPVLPMRPAAPRPRVAAEDPTSGLWNLTASSWSLSDLRFLICLASLNMGSACGVWITTGACSNTGEGCEPVGYSWSGPECYQTEGQITMMQNVEVPSCTKSAFAKADTMTPQDRASARAVRCSGVLEWTACLKLHASLMKSVRDSRKLMQTEGRQLDCIGVQGHCKLQHHG